MNKKSLLVSTVIVGLIFVVVLWYSHDSESGGKLGSGTRAYNVAQGKVATTTGEAYDVIGTRVGTTTTDVHYPLFTTYGTTTYPWRIGAEVDTVSYFINATDASTTAEASGRVTFQILASNDYSCNSATTSTDSNIVKASEVNWYDAAPFLLNKDNSTTVSVATTTLSWKPAKFGLRIVTLTNLTAKCMALRLSASSTHLQVQMVTKSNQGY